MRSEHYSCTIERDTAGSVVALVVSAVDLEDAERQVRLNGTRAIAVAGAAHDVLRRAGVSGRTWTGSRPIPLDAHTGAHIELLLTAVRPLRRSDRIAEVAEGIADMSDEEAGYWHAKAQRPRGLRALRILLEASSGGRR